MRGQTVILENHEVQAVGEVRLLRLRQLDLQDLRSRPAPSLSSRAASVGGGWPPGAGCCATSGTIVTAHASATTCPVACVITWPPFAGSGLRAVVTTVRPVFTRYCLATRCTSAAVTFAMLLGARVDEIRVVVEHRVLRRAATARCSELPSTVHETSARAGPRLLDLPVCDRARSSASRSPRRSPLRDPRPSCRAARADDAEQAWTRGSRRIRRTTFVASCFSRTIAS